MIILYLFLSHAPVPLLVAKASKLTCSGVAPGYLPVPELENTALTGNVKYILRNVYIIQIFQVPVTFHCRGTPLPHASTRPLKGALTNTVNNKLTCTPINTRLKFSKKKKTDTLTASWSDWESQIVYRGKKLSRLGGWAYQGDLARRVTLPLAKPTSCFSCKRFVNFWRKCRKIWLAPQGSSGRQVTLLSGTFFVSI